jgi:hypothetical protein
MCTNFHELNRKAKEHRSWPRTVLGWRITCTAVLASLLSAPLAAEDAAGAHRAPHETVPNISGAWQIPQQGFVSNNEPQLAPEDADPWYSGHSVGQWKGGTLYVDTVGFKIGLRDVPHSDQMRVREEIRLLKTGLFEDKVTVIDPVYLADTWQWAWQYERKPGYKIDE